MRKQAFAGTALCDVWQRGRSVLPLKSVSPRVTNLPLGDRCRRFLETAILDLVELVPPTLQVEVPVVLHNFFEE